MHSLGSEAILTRIRYTVALEQAVSSAPLLVALKQSRSSVLFCRCIAKRSSTVLGSDYFICTASHVNRYRLVSSYFCIVLHFRLDTYLLAVASVGGTAFSVQTTFRVVQLMLDQFLRSL